jgi:hypothetical protein
MLIVDPTLSQWRTQRNRHGHDTVPPTPGLNIFSTPAISLLVLPGRMHQPEKNECKVGIIKNK